MVFHGTDTLVHPGTVVEEHWSRENSRTAPSLLYQELLLLLLEHLPQHLLHDAQQSPAHTQQLVQVQAVVPPAPDVVVRPCGQPAGQRARGLSGPPGPAEASSKQGDQGTWGLVLDEARRREAPAVWRRGRAAVRLRTASEAWRWVGEAGREEKKEWKIRNWERLNEEVLKS